MTPRIVCIDPGHGLNRERPRSFDPGAVHGTYFEADIVLAYARALALQLEAAGVSVVWTRRTNEDAAPLAGRVKRATDAHCDAFISIHCNAATNRDAHGTETLYKTSKNFATDLQRATVESIGLRDRGIKPRPGLAVLQFPGPCALIELGFITNDDDRSVLLSPRTQERFAKAVTSALTGGEMA